MLVSLLSLLLQYKTGEKKENDPESYYKTIYGFHVHKVTFVLGLLYLTGSALTTGTLAQMAQADVLIMTKGIELCSYIALLLGNHFDIPFLYFPIMIVFTFNSVLQLIYSAYLYLTAYQIIPAGYGLADHWDQFASYPDQAVQASITLFSQTSSGIYFLWIVFRSWQYLRFAQKNYSILRNTQLAIKQE